MSMYIGEYKHVLDEKGRVSMPAKFREDLGEVFYITKGMDDCLFVYDAAGWEKAGEKIGRLQVSRDVTRALGRLFFAGAVQQSLDRQGRALIPQNLREYANLKKEVAIIGVSDRLEIWDLDAWNAYSNSEEFNYDALTAHMEDLDF